MQPFPPLRRRDTQTYNAVRRLYQKTSSSSLWMFNVVLTGQTMWSKDFCRWSLPVKWVSMFPKFFSILRSFSGALRFPIAVSEQSILFDKSVSLTIVNNFLRLKSYSWRRNSSLPKSRETRMTEPQWRSRVSCAAQYEIQWKIQLCAFLS